MKSIRMATAAFLFTAMSPALSGCGEGVSEQTVGEAQGTLIELTADQARQFEVNSGGVWDEKIVGGFVVLNDTLTEEQKQSFKAEMLNREPKAEQERAGDVQAQWCTGYYLSNVQYQGNSWYFTNKRLGSSEGWGPITLSLTVSTSVSAQWSANVGVSAEVVSAGVGYSVTATYGVSSQGSWNVPSGTYGRLEGYALHNKHTWDVWNDDCGDPADTYSGSGSSYKPNGGVYFKKVSL